MNQQLILAPYLNKNITGNRVTTQLLQIGLGVLFLALLAQVAIPIPGSPVPITGQTFGVLCLGLFYGRSLGLKTIVAYLLLGSLGMPLFAKGGSGILFFSATGGYLIGYIFAVLLCGYLAEKGWTKSFVKLGAAMLMAEVLIYFFGLVQLSYFVPGGTVLASGLYPFVFGDLVKMLLIVGAFPLMWALKKRQ